MSAARQTPCLVHDDIGYLLDRKGRINQGIRQFHKCLVHRQFPLASCQDSLVFRDIDTVLDDLGDPPPSVKDGEGVNLDFMAFAASVVVDMFHLSRLLRLSDDL